MGKGDTLLALGAAWHRYKSNPDQKIAIGDGRRVDPANLSLTYGLGHYVATQAEADTGNVSWLIDYAGARQYIDYVAMRKKLEKMGITVQKNRHLVQHLRHYIHQPDFRPHPAPIVLSPDEEAYVEKLKELGPFVVVEPYIKDGAPPAKKYPIDRFVEAVKALEKEIPVYQISVPTLPSIGLPRMDSGSFRGTLALLKASALYIGPEGGLHHAAAAVGTKATVLFGGFISPNTTGYDFHDNLTGGVTQSCGTRYDPCSHCTKAMNNITPTDIVASARKLLCN